MSSLDKMLIQGIRNFDPQRTNVIEFFHPLTVIVGPNGSGKTVSEHPRENEEEEEEGKKKSKKKKRVCAGFFFCVWFFLFSRLYDQVFLSECV